MTKFKEGQKVHYDPIHGSGAQNGMVKSITNNEAGIFVVYHCNDDWKDYRNYTAQLTPAIEVKDGWINNK